jgi:small-conductance mechanosensitive channel
MPVRLILLAVITLAMPAVESLPLNWDRHPITVLRVPLAEHTPAERARRAIDRFEELARSDGPLQVVSREIPDGTLIEIDGQGVLVLTDGDADRLIGEDRAAAAAAASKRLQAALLERRQARNGQGLVDTVLVAVAASIAWIFACWLVLRARSILVRRIAPVEAGETPAAGTVAMRLVRKHLLRTLSVWGINLLAVGALLTITSVCSTIGLSSLPATHRWAVELIQSLSLMLWELFVAVCASLPGLLMAIAIFAVAGAIHMVLARFFSSVRAGRLQLSWIDIHTARPTRLLTTLVLWGAALVMAYPYLPGSSSEAFKGISVLLGLMISLGASSQVGQLASGFILIYMRSLKPGDYVRVGSAEGTVKDIGLFTLTMITPFDEVVSLPNVVVLGNQVTNYSRPAGTATAQLQVPVTIGYDTSWRMVHELLLASVEGIPGVLMAPPPVVLQRALSDFYVEYTLCVRISDPTARVHVLSRLHAAILDRFHAAGVQIMSPHYLGDPAKPKLAAEPAPIRI